MATTKDLDKNLAAIDSISKENISGHQAAVREIQDRFQIFPNRPPAKPISPFLPKSFSQLLNLFKIIAGLGLSLLTRKAYVWGTPIIVHIEPTSLCNLRCPLCPSGNGELTRERAKMTFRQFKTVIDKLPSTVRMLLLWNQGEPFLVKDLANMIRYAKQKSMYIVTSTNGHFFRKPGEVEKIVQSGIDEIIISLDGADQESYQKYRIGGNLEIVKQGVRDLAFQKNRLNYNKPLLHLQFILMKHNVTQKKKMIELGKEMGADKLSFKTLQVTSWKEGEEFLPDDPAHTRYEGKREGGIYKTHRRRFFPNDCLRLWYSAVVNCDGQLSPCCFDKDGEYSTGNLLESDFTSIWKGKSFQNFRQRLLDSRLELEMCQDCTEGLANLFPETIDYHKKE
jgi:radical SAM protein with 4Fe4S-binding SPASM domain